MTTWRKEKSCICLSVTPQTDTLFLLLLLVLPLLVLLLLYAARCGAFMRFPCFPRKLNCQK